MTRRPIKHIKLKINVTKVNHDVCVNASNNACIVCGKEIIPERIEALISLGIQKPNWTCVEHSLSKRRMGIYLGEVGTSELLVVDRVYNDSVRGIFKRSEVDVDEEAGEVQETDKVEPLEKRPEEPQE